MSVIYILPLINKKREKDNKSGSDILNENNYQYFVTSLKSERKKHY